GNGTSAATSNDDGATPLYHHTRDLLAERGLAASEPTLAPVGGKVSTRAATVVPPQRGRYLADIADTVRRYHERTDEQVAAVGERAALTRARAALDRAGASTVDIDALAADAARRG